MDRVHPEGARNRQAFIVRIWRSEAVGQWHMSVQDVATAERQDFAGLEALFQYFRQRVGDTAVIPRGPPEDTGSDDG